MSARAHFDRTVGQDWTGQDCGQDRTGLSTGLHSTALTALDCPAAHRQDGQTGQDWTAEQDRTGLLDWTGQDWTADRTGLDWTGLDRWTGVVGDFVRS